MERGYLVSANFKVVRPGEAGTKGWAKLMLIRSKFTCSGFHRERPCQQLAPDDAAYGSHSISIGDMRKSYMKSEE